MSKVQLSPSLNKFADRVRIMNQSQSNNLVLTAAEARNMQSDIMNLLLIIAQLASAQRTPEQTVAEIQIVAPTFK
jgi:hypothetical protein